MKNFSLHYVLWLLCLLSPMALSAQDLSVRSLEQVPDATASMFEYQLQDNNGDFAGIMKVHIAVDGVKFDGGGVLKQQKMDMGEYWVWMAKDSSRLTVRAPGFLPLEVNFRKYEGVNIVHSKTTYKLVLTVPNAGGQSQDDGKGYIMMEVEPKNAKVMIEGKEFVPVDGGISELVARGSYHYEVSASGYESQSGTLTTVENWSDRKVVRLRSTMSTLQVTCATAGAQIYLDGRLRGTAPQTLTLSNGSHRIEARLEGYRQYREDLTIGHNENRRLDIPALERLTGTLRVNFTPPGGEVYLDGEKLGNIPGTYRNIAVGSHQVEIRKDGYVSESKTVSVNEDAITDLSGSLTASATPVQNDNANPTNNAVSSLSSGGNIKTFTANGVSFNMVRVEGGTYTDGSGDKKTVGTFMIGETEVTQELWEAVMGKNPSRFKGAKNPVENVSWEDCQEFIDKLNTVTGQRFRLPTEWEWEFAACGGTKSRGYEYSGSNDIDEVAWYEENAYKKGSSSPDYGTHPVGKKRANELGIYDMSGNVREWCEDLYSSSSSDRVTRGGGWLSSARICRVSPRGNDSPGNRSNYLGFRLAH